MKYVEGLDLGEIKGHASSSLCQSIGDEAIRGVNLVADRGILNKDIKTRNILIWEEKEASNSKVFFIGFGDCRFREADEPKE